MGLKQDLEAINAGTKEILDDCNATISSNGVSEADSMSEIPAKIEAVYRKGVVNTQADVITSASRIFNQYGLLGCGSIGSVYTRTHELYEAGNNNGKTQAHDEFWDAYQDNGNRINYNSAFAGRGWRADTLKPKYKISPKESSSSHSNARNIFFLCNFGNEQPLDFSTISHMFDFSECRNVNSIFDSANMVNIFADFSNCITMNAAFASNFGRGVNFVTVKVSEACTSFAGIVTANTTITDLIFTDDSVIAVNMALSPATKLTHESLMSVIRALKDFTGTTTARTLTLGSKNLAKLTDTEKAMATEKGWTLA